MQNETDRRNFGAWVDMFRWVAAFSVLVTHAGIRMFPPVAEMPARFWPHIAYAFVAGFDHQAVMAFFVLSGLLVGGAVVREVRTTGTIKLRRYLAKRAVRLGIVLWPALALAAACDAVALRWGAVGFGVLPGDIQASLTAPVLACNMLLLQTAACVQFGGVGALWSLFNEGCYYLLFPAVALAWLAPWPRHRRAACLLAVAAALAGLTSVQFTGLPVGPYMLVWGVGVGVAALDRPVLRSAFWAAMLFGVLLLAVRLCVRRSFAGEHPYLAAELDLAVALAFGNLLLSLRFCRALRPPPAPALHRALAGFSFSLYCTHIPVLTLGITVLMASTGLGWQMRGLGLGPWLALGAMLTACLGGAYVFSRLTEANTDAARRALWRLSATRLRAPS